MDDANQIIVGQRLTNCATDRNQLIPMLNEIEKNLEPGSLRHKMMVRLKKGGYRSRYRLRKQTVEPVLEQIKQTRSFRQILSEQRQGQGSRRMESGRHQSTILENALTRPGKFLIVKYSDRLLIRIMLLPFLCCLSLSFASQDRSKAGLDENQWISQGSELLRRSRYNEAETVFRDWVQNEPTSPDAHYYLALSWALQARLEEALSGFKQVLLLDPGRADAEPARRLAC